MVERPPSREGAGSSTVGEPADDPAGGERPIGPSRRYRRPTPRVVALGATVVLLALGTLAWARGRGDSGPAPLDRAAVAALVDERVDRAQQQTQAAPARSAEVYRTILPSIVVIRAAQRGATGRDTGSSLGTGVVINADGSIMTAAHVIDGAATITVVFADGTESAADVRSADRATDIAVLAPASKPEVVVPATLGGGVRVGDDTYAVGHPLGLVGSLSAGVISGLDRSIPRGDGQGRLTGLIQFDAAVNPGNSGGPLLDRNGRVVGIVTAIADPSQDGSFIGIGFAVPIATAGGAAGAPPR